MESVFEKSWQIGLSADVCVIARCVGGSREVARDGNTGEQNSRFKDFYIMHSTASAFRFERSTLVAAIRATFERRATPIVEETPVALRATFYADSTRAVQWRAYVTRSGMTGVPQDFAAIGERIISFLQPVWDVLKVSDEPRREWSSEEGWR